MWFNRARPSSSSDAKEILEEVLLRVEQWSHVMRKVPLVWQMERPQRRRRLRTFLLFAEEPTGAMELVF
jgi:hypothetical protein